MWWTQNKAQLHAKPIQLRRLIFNTCPCFSFWFFFHIIIIIIKMLTMFSGNTVPLWTLPSLCFGRLQIRSKSVIFLFFVDKFLVLSQLRHYCQTITNWLYQPVYLFEQLYVKCMFQGTKGTVQKTSAIYYLSTAFYTGKWLCNAF